MRYDLDDTVLAGYGVTNGLLNFGDIVTNLLFDFGDTVTSDVDTWAIICDNSPELPGKE